MGRKRTDSLLEKKGRYRIGITDPTGFKHWRRLKPGTTEARAKAMFESWKEQAAADPVKFFKRFEQGEGERGGPFTRSHPGRVPDDLLRPAQDARER